MPYLDHIYRCNIHDLSHFRPFRVDGVRVGWVKGDFAKRLESLDYFMVEGDGGVAMKPLADAAERSAAMAEALDVLAGEGWLRLRREAYAVAPRFGAPALLTMDRGAVIRFGVPAYGVHVNGLVRHESGLHMWIGRRAPDKRVEPNKLDNLIGGGQPAGLGLMDNVIKEGHEEAGLAADLAAQAVPVGTISYVMETEQGLKPDTMFCYDLEVPQTFQPICHDGEIVEFYCLPMVEVARLVRDTTDFKFNVNLVVIDCLVRLGFIDPDKESDYVALCGGLRAGSLGY